MNFGGNKLKYGQQFVFLQAGSISSDFDRILIAQGCEERITLGSFATLG